MKWALLVGIDHYPGLHQPDYQGCVHDVHKISELLCDVYGFDSKCILRLTSPQEVPDSVSSFDSWPSYDNIVSSIRGILKEVGPDDIVYIHFSGCVVSVASKLALGRCVNDALDLALVPVDIVSTKRYLHDVELAVLLHDLSKKGADVTMVVDGRFYLREISPSKSSAFTSKELDTLPHHKWTQSGRYTWLESPDPELSYTLLLTRSMIDRHNHWEYLDDRTEEWSGHLTSLLHQTIRSDGPFIQLRTLAQRLQEKVSRLSHPDYSATEFSTAGNPSRLFIVGDRSRSHWPPIFPAVMIQKANGKSIEVGAGSAHGIQLGARFFLNPGLGSKPFLTRPRLPIAEKFQVEVVGGLTSTAVLVDEDVSNPGDPLNTSDVIFSVMLHWSSTKAASGHSIHGNNRYYPQEKADIEQDTSITPLSPLEQANLYKSLLNIKTENEEFSRSVKVAVLGGYRYMPSTIPPDSTFGLVPPTTVDGCLHLLSGDFATIYIQGQGTTPKQLFVYVVSFDSDFGITQVYPDSYSGTPRLIEKFAYKHNKYALSLLLRLAISSTRQNDPQFGQASEVLKVFVTDQPTSFTCLEVPGVTDEEFLQRLPDPARTLLKSTDGARVDSSAVFFEAPTSDLSSEPYSFDRGAGYDRSKDEITMEEPPDIEIILRKSAEFGLDSLWCCFDLSFVIHKTIDTLAQTYPSEL